MPEKKLIDTDWISKFKGPIENVLCDVENLNEQFLFLNRDISVDFDIYFKPLQNCVEDNARYDVHLYVNRQNVPGIDMYDQFFDSSDVDGHFPVDQIRIYSSNCPEVCLDPEYNGCSGILYLMGRTVSTYQRRTRISRNKNVSFRKPRFLKQIIDNTMSCLTRSLSYAIEDKDARTDFKHLGYNEETVKPVEMLAICPENIFIPDSLSKYGYSGVFGTPVYFTHGMDSLMFEANRALGCRSILSDVRDINFYGKNMFFDNNGKLWLLIREEVVERGFFERMPLFRVLDPQESILKLRFDIDASDFVSEKNANMSLTLNESAQEQYATTCKCISLNDGSEFNMDTYVAENKFPNFNFKINFTCGIDPSIIRNTLLPRITIRE